MFVALGTFKICYNIILLMICLSILIIGSLEWKAGIEKEGVQEVETIQFDIDAQMKQKPLIKTLHPVPLGEFR